MGDAGPVTGQVADSVTGTVTADVLERLGDLAVRPGLAGRPEVVVEGVLDQGVGEGVVAGVSVSSRTNVAAVAASRMSSTSSSGRHGGPSEHVEVEVAADHRGERQHPLGVAAEPPDTGADHGADAGRQAPSPRVVAVATHRPVTASWLIAPGLGEMAEDLADEERVAVGLAMQRPGEAQRRRRRGCVRRPPPSVTRRRRRRARPAPSGRRRRAVQLGKRVEQRVRVGQLGVAVGSRARASASGCRRRAGDAAAAGWPGPPTAGHRAPARSAAPATPSQRARRPPRTVGSAPCRHRSL